MWVFKVGKLPNYFARVTVGFLQLKQGLAIQQEPV
jgi:hypothetical protein